MLQKTGKYMDLILNREKFWDLQTLILLRLKKFSKGVIASPIYRAKQSHSQNIQFRFCTSKYEILLTLRWEEGFPPNTWGDDRNNLPCFIN